MVGKLSPGDSNLVRPMAMNEGNDEIAQSRHDLWSVARAKLGVVFARSVTSRTYGNEFSMRKYTSTTCSSVVGW
jgi:hypothetical protein